MIPENIKRILIKQHYEIVGEHSGVQTCSWTKKSLRDEGVCYKEKFYGIKSHLCCQMTPSVLWCPNKCLHCWRAVELTLGNKIEGKVDSAKEIVEGCIKAQRKLLTGFNKDPKSKKQQLSRANMQKLKEAQEPMQFAISLSGEPTLYPKIGELITELRKRGKTSFLVTNGLYPEKIKELAKKNQLPTQLYVSVNIPLEKNYQDFHRSSLKDAWEKLSETLEFLPSIKNRTRTVFRINLVKGKNMQEEDIEAFADLIKIADPKFVEIKGFMCVGFSRQRLSYDKMPWHKEILEFAKKLEKKLKDKKVDLKILDEHEISKAVVLGNNKNELKIKKNEI